MTSETNLRRRTARLLIFTAVVFFVLSLFSVGRFIQWPFVILSTFVHEMGHGITAMLVGGRFVSMELYPDASGLAQLWLPSTGWHSALAAAGGLLAPPLLGGALICAGQSRQGAARILISLSVVMVLACLIWIRSVFGFVTLLAMGIGFFWLARRRQPGLQLFLVQFIGVHMLVDTVTRTFGYLFTSNAVVNGSLQHSDTSAIANALGGYHFIWGLVIAMMVVGIFYFSLRRVYTQ